MDYLRGILVFVLCGISVITALTGKGYYCRDPDTGYLHPANSTWHSTTFCGNYTCKLRKRDPNQVQLPLRAINISYVNMTQPSQARSDMDDTLPKTEDANILQVDKAKATENVLSLDSPELAILKSLLPTGLTDLSKLKIQERLKHHESFNDGSENADRFLTEEEIKSISELLHTVKKSDLEAIVDIYSLAQDIYKEMDKMTSENIVEETMRFANVLNDKPSDKKISYWYEPSYRLNKPDVKVDMDHQGSNVVTTTAPMRTTTIPGSYFSGPLTKTDFGKLPYYYPMSSFQRQSSYIHPTYNSQLHFPSVKPPCNTQVNNAPPASPAHYPPPAPYNYANPPQNYGGVIKRPFTVETQKQVPPSNLLPYPFSYIQHYNMSAYPFNNYYEENPWARFDLNKNHNQKSFYKSQIVHSQSNAIPANSEKREQNMKTDAEDKKPDTSNLLDTLLANAKTITKTKPEWQTDPLPVNILDEVRAHFAEKAKLLKPFSLRKKVKLERVGKVVKLDDLHREKRSLDDGEKLNGEEEEDVEAYIEKTTCLSDIDPGYFRMGNLSEPYPACCPQRIADNSR